MKVELVKPVWFSSLQYTIKCSSSHSKLFTPHFRVYYFNREHLFYHLFLSALRTVWSKTPMWKLDRMRLNIISQSFYNLILMIPFSVLYCNASSRNSLLILYKGTKRQQHESKRSRRMEYTLCSWHISSTVTWLFNTIPCSAILEFPVQQNPVHPLKEERLLHNLELLFQKSKVTQMIKMIIIIRFGVYSQTAN